MLLAFASAAECDSGDDEQDNANEAGFERFQAKGGGEEEHPNGRRRLDLRRETA